MKLSKKLKKMNATNIGLLWGLIGAGVILLFDLTGITFWLNDNIQAIYYMISLITLPTTIAIITRNALVGIGNTLIQHILPVFVLSGVFGVVLAHIIKIIKKKL